MNALIPVYVGDTIVVNGELFVLVEWKRELDKPSTVEFRQPCELINQKEPS